MEMYEINVRTYPKFGILNALLLPLFFSSLRRTEGSQATTSALCACISPYFFENKAFFPLIRWYIYSRIIPMSLNYANFNQKPQNSTQKMPTAFFATDLGNRQLYTSSK